MAEDVEFIRDVLEQKVQKVFTKAGIKKKVLEFWFFSLSFSKSKVYVNISDSNCWCVSLARRTTSQKYAASGSSFQAEVLHNSYDMVYNFSVIDSPDFKNFTKYQN